MARRRGRPRIVKRGCPFCATSTAPDYKDVEVLRRFTKQTGAIKRRQPQWDKERERWAGGSGVCRPHQRQLAKAIERARFMGLLPYRLPKEMSVPKK